MRSLTVMNGASRASLRSEAPLATPVVLSVTDSVGVTNARAASTRVTKRRRPPASAKMCTSPLAPDCDSVVGALPGANVDDRELPAFLCGVDRRRKHSAVDGRDLHSVGRAVVVDDLDVVGTLGDARIDEGLRVGR